MQSTNPATGEILSEIKTHTSKEVSHKLIKAEETFHYWRKKSFQDRGKKMFRLAEVLREKRQIYASLISREMGMPISQSLAEIEKTAQVAEYYAENAAIILADKPIDTGSKESFIKHDPMGIILHVAPWNFPIYLALRPVLPAIMAGNTVLMKHSSNVPQISQAIESLFIEADFEEGIFQSLLIPGKEVEPVIRDSRIKMVTLIGSEQAGMQIAKVAGEEIKKTVMELGGSDAFIVLADADFEKVFPQATAARLRNCGQSCNAAKRFIVMEEVANQFIARMKTEFEEQIPGDPLEDKTQIGPIATSNSLDDIKRQVEESIIEGAEIITGGHGHSAKLTKEWKAFLDEHKQGYYYPPTILTKITKEMPVYNQEIFGPIAPIIIVQSLEEAIQVANDSPYGLSSSLWTEDYNLAKTLISELEVGNVFINSMVRSNIKMPYGGVKKSGYGREMGEYGILEMVNIKTVVIK